MKLSIKNLKGEVFQVDAEPTDSVNIQQNRSPSSKLKSNRLRDCQPSHSKLYIKAKPLQTKIRFKNWALKKLIF